MKTKSGMILMIALFGLWGCSKDEDESADDTQAATVTVVINEVMPKNSSTITDQDEEYDDWIELYNTTSSAVDLSGYFLSDSKNNITKWSFPEGTVIAAKGYLTVWADTDTLQTGLHTNFKLAAEGEKVVLANPDQEIMDQTSYDEQSSELSYARVPDGTGSFAWRTPSFGTTNGTTAN